ncbi:MAG: DctP family TRAP transporter solute-binding subunit [Magnetococcales bacterium]|nr:DctP family TRAP transporter solute-binding subunit [Magnetococcales bacterium]
MKERQVTTILTAMLLVILFILSARIYTRTASEEPRIQTAESNTLRLGLNIPIGTALHEAAELFAKEVSKASHGRLQVRVHPNQELGNDNQMLELARRGELAMVLTPTAKLSIAVPAMQVLDLPFFFNTPQTLYTALDGQFGEKLLQKLDRIGLKGVTFWENGFKHFTANQPLGLPADFDGLKMRIMKSPIIQEQFESMGAVTIPIDFHATHKALANGVVDGQENPLIAIVSMGFHTVQSHLTLSSHAYLGYVFSISKKRLDALSLNDQNILIQTAKKITRWEREETQRREKDLLEQIKNQEVQVSLLTPDQIDVFQQKMAHIPRKFEAILGSDVVSLAQEYITLDRLEDLEEQDRPLLIGLDADLSTMNPLASLAIKQGATLASHEINQHGGVLGRKLHLLTRDHQGVPERGIDNIRFFNQLPNLVAIMAGKQSTIIGEEKKLVEEFGIPFLVPREEREVIVPQTIFLSPPINEKGQKILNNYRQFFHTEPDLLLQAGSGFANAYDLVHLLAVAIEKAGIADRVAIRNALESLPPHEGRVKRYQPTFSQTNHDALNQSDIKLGRFQGQGDLLPVNAGSGR